MNYTPLKDISSKVWWYKQDWAYFVNPMDSKSNYKLVPIRCKNPKIIYLPFYYKKIKISFYSEFLIENTQHPYF
jgi:hypothetical protein